MHTRIAYAWKQLNNIEIKYAEKGANTLPKRLHNALNPKTVAALTKSGVYGDGNGLQLKIDDRGNKRWIQRMTVAGCKRRRYIGPRGRIDC